MKANSERAIRIHMVFDPANTTYMFVLVVGTAGKQANVHQQGTCKKKKKYCYLHAVEYYPAMKRNGEALYLLLQNSLKGEVSDKNKQRNNGICVKRWGKVCICAVSDRFHVHKICLKECKRNN